MYQRILNCKTIKRILKEELNGDSDDFQWIKDIEVETDLSPGSIYFRYDGFTEEARKLVGPMMVSEFDNLTYKDDRIILTLDSYCHFTELFRDSEYDGYVGEHIARLILCDDDGDYWEPYHDIVHNWIQEVWDLVTDKPKLTKYVLDYIKEKHIGEEVEDKMSENGYDERPLDKEYFKWLSQNLGELGDLIDDDDTFDDLKNELRWSYEDAYNNASRDEIYFATMGAIMEDFGKGEWVSRTILRGGEEKITYDLVFDITGLFWSSVEDWFYQCWRECYGSNEIDWFRIDDIEEECEDCQEIDEWYGFIGFYANKLSEEGYKYNPQYSDYPSDDKFKEYFEESVYGRF